MGEGELKTKGTREPRAGHVHRVSKAVVGVEVWLKMLLGFSLPRNQSKVKNPELKPSFLKA